MYHLSELRLTEKHHMARQNRVNAVATLALVVCALAVGSCSGTTSPGFPAMRTVAGRLPKPGSQQSLYVSSYDQGNVTTYSLSGAPQNFSITGLDNPNDVTVDANGYIYITNFSGSNQGVSVYNSNGTVVCTIAVPRPLGVAVDSSGKIYVGSYSNGTVTTYNPEPTCTQTTPTITGLQVPYGVAVDSLGNIYIGQAQSACSLTKYTASGNVIWTTTTNTGRTGLIALDQGRGRVYLSNGTECDGSGTGWMSTYSMSSGSNIAPTITSGLNVPGGIAVSANGNIYIANYGGGSGSTVTVYSPNGSGPTSTITVPEGPSGAAIAASPQLPQGFSLSVTPKTQKVNLTATGSYTINVTPIGGFSGTVTLGVSCPYSSTCPPPNVNFSPLYSIQVPATETEPFEINTAPNLLALGTYGFTITASASGYKSESSKIHFAASGPVTRVDNTINLSSYSILNSTGCTNNCFSIQQNTEIEPPSAQTGPSFSYWAQNVIFVTSIGSGTYAQANFNLFQLQPNGTLKLVECSPNYLGLCSPTTGNLVTLPAAWSMSTFINAKNELVMANSAGTSNYVFSTPMPTLAFLDLGYIYNEVSICPGSSGALLLSPELMIVGGRTSFTGVAGSVTFAPSTSGNVGMSMNHVSYFIAAPRQASQSLTAETSSGLLWGTAGNAGAFGPSESISAEGIGFCSLVSGTNAVRR
jgi:hypothetical protein